MTLIFLVQLKVVNLLREVDLGLLDEHETLVILLLWDRLLVVSMNICGTPNIEHFAFLDYGNSVTEVLSLIKPVGRKKHRGITLFYKA